MGESAEPFHLALAAASERAARDSIDDIGTMLVRQIAVLQTAGRLLSLDFRSFYEQEPDGFARLFLFTESLYQQIHSAVTSAAVFIGREASPALRVAGLAELRKVLAANPSHGLAGAFAALPRELGLLRWLCSVRNKAIQHRAEAGYLGGRAVVLQNGFAMLHKVESDPAANRKAREMFDRMAQAYGRWDVEPVDSREMVTYLDLASHELLPVAPDDFDRCRRVVEEAAARDLIVSPAMLENTDASLAALIKTAP